jgi:NAD(P)-dependent dehydrogenase (short-subunit alcohol dehydrogenase family)
MANSVRYDFNGKHAVVTGGAAGIGQACVEQFLAAGARVSLWDRDPSALRAAQERHARISISSSTALASRGRMQRWLTIL